MYDEKPKKKTSSKMINYFYLYRFAEPIELFLIFIGFIFAFIKALSMPFLIIVYSEFCALLVDRTYGIGTNSETVLLPLFGGGKMLTNASIEENRKELYNDSISYGILMSIASIVIFISGIISIDIFNRTALKQVTRIRNLFFRSIIRQDIGWHDTATDQNFALRITDDIEKIRDGMSEKVAHFINLMVGFVVTIIISFYYGWKLTLAVIIYIPIVILTNYFVGKYQGKLTVKESDAYAGAGSLIEEVLSGIRTVVAFNGEEKEADRYDQLLIPARKAGRRKGAFTGFGDGVLRSFLFLSCGAAFWYGINLILDDRDKADKEYTPAILMIAFFGIIVGADNIARSAPFLESFALARASGTIIFKVIDQEPKIDPLSLDGKILNYGLKGDIEFQDVFFRYPSREEITVLRGLSLKVKSGETVALVGHSGCGKSTCIQLIQRFYDPIFGEILLDGLDITKYNISWLRSNIAIVGQEPVLFSGTIGENINFGKPDATQKEIEEAAKAAGVHEFITNLPESYQTLIGEKGAQLSGGQKQRIAIARALIQNPKILLLDEATSALDYQSEKLVQEALDVARKGRTTIVVSHRLSAIKTADRIVFIEKGKVAEEGTHEELMKLNGLYYDMVTAGGIELENGLKSKDSELAVYEKSFGLDTINLQDHQNDTDNDHSMVKFSPEIIKTDDEKQIKEIKNTGTDYLKTFNRILRSAKPESFILILGFICSALFGCVYPLFAVLFGEFYAALAMTDENEALKSTAFLSILCIVIGIGTGILCFLQTYFFNLAGLRLALRMRSQIFRSIVKQEMAWFDQNENNVGALSAKLSGDVANIQGAIGFPLSNIIQSITNFGLGVSLAFYYSWKLALLCLSTVPFIAGSVVYEAKSMSETTVEEKTILEEASQIATEAITNIRTVAGLRREPYIIAQYNSEIEKIEKKIINKVKFRGLVNSCGNAFPFFGYAAALCYGGVLVSQGTVNFQNIIKTSESLLYSSMMLGQSLAFVPAFTTALVAANRLFKIIDRKPAIQSSKKISRNTNTSSNNHGVTYSNISFRYPKRPDVQILKDFNLNVPQGKTIALVGHSGCGKSTCIQLLQRFYEPDNGRIHIDKDDIVNDLTLEELRGKLGIVSQEPVLFERTIAENIAYGDNSREVSLVEVMEAAKLANIHTFIISLPLGYETKLGSKGTQLSGGQKQRVAIARALIRNPKILLLDEATSALDLQSEKTVQAALDTACSGRTCIVIAHRLSTIQSVDIICVVQNGKIVEHGNHQQLLAKNGIYAELYRTQPDLH